MANSHKATRLLRVFARYGSLALFFWAVLGTSALAETRFANVFSDNMVLQQKKPITIWGHADANVAVEVTFGEEKATTKADAKGHWAVQFAARKATFDPVKLTRISARSTTARSFHFPGCTSAGHCFTRARTTRLSFTRPIGTVFPVSFEIGERQIKELKRKLKALGVEIPDADTE